MRGLKSFTFTVGIIVNVYVFAKFYQVFKYYKSKYDEKINKFLNCIQDNLNGKLQETIVREIKDSG